MRFVFFFGLLATGLASCASTEGTCYLRLERGCARGTLTSAREAPVRCGAAGEFDLVFYRSARDCAEEKNASAPTGGNAATGKIPGADSRD
jgi:hypothetical protein